MRKIIFLVSGFLFLLPFAASAQKASGVPVPADTVLADKPAAPAADPDRQKRIELATKMTELTPPRDAVNMAIARVVNAAPPEQRQVLIAKLTAAFDFDAFRQTVTNDMAQTFTAAELQKMIEYHSSPEAQSIADKMPDYEAKIQPELTRMIDVALMLARTGGKADVKVAPPTTQPGK